MLDPDVPRPEEGEEAFSVQGEAGEGQDALLQNSDGVQKATFDKKADV